MVDAVLEMFRMNQQEVRQELDTILDSYVGAPSEFVPLDITEDTMMVLGRRISGGGGGGADAVINRHWIICYVKIHDIVAFLTEWFANDRPLWAAYNALITGRLIGLDNQPGIRPFGTVDTWRRCFTKYVLVVASLEA